jgi:16S rRNA (adenine1518-N6/adenine1519-N6)-dimethyltransferase
MNVKAKKHLGQHFLINTAICEKIVQALPVFETPMKVVEIGPGKGAITDFFLQRTDLDFCAFEVDLESILYLKKAHPEFNKVYSQDFLEANFGEYFQEDQFCVVGNFPYNISSQILFKCLESTHQIPIILGMFQKEVARRIAEPPGRIWHFKCFDASILRCKLFVYRRTRVFLSPTKSKIWRNSLC